MSDEIWVQRFDRGEPRNLSPAAFDEVFGPYITDSRPRLHFHRVVAPDGAGADFYADFGPPFASLMASRLSGGAVCDLLVSFARRCDAVILLTDPPCSPTRASASTCRRRSGRRPASQLWAGP